MSRSRNQIPSFKQLLDSSRWALPGLTHPFAHTAYHKMQDPLPLYSRVFVEEIEVHICRGGVTRWDPKRLMVTTASQGEP
jgi:hypothetical protein